MASARNSSCSVAPLAYTNVGCEGAVVHIPMPLKALENGGARCVVSALELQDTIQCFLRGAAA